MEFEPPRLDSEKYFEGQSSLLVSYEGNNFVFAIAIYAVSLLRDVRYKKQYVNGDYQIVAIRDRNDCPIPVPPEERLKDLLLISPCAATKWGDTETLSKAVREFRAEQVIGTPALRPFRSRLKMPVRIIETIPDPKIDPNFEVRADAECPEKLIAFGREVVRVGWIDRSPKREAYLQRRRNLHLLETL